jgi:DNA-binding beta-propeller fold protein YncE
VRVTKSLRGLRVAGATVLALCLAWCCASCSSAARRATSPTGVASARPGRAVATSPKTTSGKQLWVSSLPGAYGGVGAVSPDGRTVFVSGLVQGRLVKTHYETVAYRAATGARLWASSYQPGGNLYSYPVALTVSPDGARVYVTTDFHFIGRGQGIVIFAYDARTGRQLWASRYRPKDSGAGVSGLAVSPDGTTLYVAGTLGQAHSLFFGVIAYAAATGKQRWLRYSTGKRGYADSVAVSPDGKTVYATGVAGSAALTVAYGAAGTLKWATRYKDPYGFAAGSQIVAAPGGGAVYVAGKAANKNGHFDVATFAYRTATGRRMWLDRHSARNLFPAPDIAVTPGGQTVIVTVPLNHGTSYAIASYNASTGTTRWTRRVPYSFGRPSGLVINPPGDTMFIGGNRTTAYSVADGTVAWTTSYNRNFPDFGVLSGIIGLSGDGTRLFAARQTKQGITWSIAIVAYRT